MPLPRFSRPVGSVGLRLAGPVLVATAALALGLPGPAPAGGSPTAPPDRIAGTVTVSAASSLADAFSAIARRFERRHPAADVRLNLGSSTTLATQIVGGAPASVFAAADGASMDRVVDRGLTVGTPVVFARNSMAIAVKRGNPKGVTGATDLGRAGVVALCAASAPCGIYAARVLEKAGVSLPESTVTRAADATATLTAVSRGDADAAVVYESDVVRAGRAVTRVAIPDGDNVDAEYPVVVLAGADAPRAARAFVAAVTSPSGRRILVGHGFGAP